jgi:hypothetical protein
VVAHRLELIDGTLFRLLGVESGEVVVAGVVVEASSSCWSGVVAPGLVVVAVGAT